MTTSKEGYGCSYLLRACGRSEVYRSSVLNLEAVRFIKTQLRSETTDGFRRIGVSNQSVNLSVEISRVY
ncbi:hypothetical protein AGR2A_Cc70046 [Agrobacterium genomosp. 2 str. CFBP 5494]|uniref:Uncharacterized protein n=1 Tax=Agrobacterium genomosp. 2 str. CFBP 5494 TaxID=1183436 RepID=A0A9W5B2L9_9HYPH|nr:hypothetical protein AGR2A_Cc70046 [Agrobacterium genomosp. 2 str. CFBP 5494]